MTPVEWMRHHLFDSRDERREARQRVDRDSRRIEHQARRIEQGADALEHRVHEVNHLAEAVYAIWEKK